MSAGAGRRVRKLARRFAFPPFSSSVLEPNLLNFLSKKKLTECSSMMPQILIDSPELATRSVVDAVPILHGQTRPDRELVQRLVPILLADME